jgi:hypothetical protein
MKNGTIRIYGCGGAGTNIAQQFFGLEEDPNFAEIKTTIIDTSRSNLHGGIPDEACFILPDVDGSGKVRKENHEEIAKSIKPILVKHQPESLNIVVFSTAGGKQAKAA